MGNYYGYMRISTKEKQDKQSFNRQKKGLERYSKEKKIDYVLTLKDDYTGKTFNRPEWKRLEKIIQKGDTIVFKEISRFTREAEPGYKKYMELVEKGINLIFLDNPTVNTSYIQQLTNVAETQDLVTRTALEGTINLLLIVELDRVQKERENIVKRIKQGIESSDKRQGRKPGKLIKITPELKADIQEFLNNRDIKQIDLLKKHGISRNTLKKYIEVMKNK